MQPHRQADIESQVFRQSEWKTSRQAGVPLSIGQAQALFVRYGDRAAHPPAPTRPNSVSSRIALGPHSGRNGLTIKGNLRTAQTPVTPARLDDQHLFFS